MLLSALGSVVEKWRSTHLARDQSRTATTCKRCSTPGTAFPKALVSLSLHSARRTPSTHLSSGQQRKGQGSRHSLVLARIPHVTIQTKLTAILHRTSTFW